MIDTQKNISVVFSLIILLLISLGGLSLTYLNNTADEIENLYHHPYTVSNAARDIEINLISMHRNMKDVALADNNQQIKEATTLVDKHERHVLNDFQLIFERYLGDRNDIENAYNAFIEWKVIRDEVIFLKTQGRDKEAADITKNKSATHVAMLNAETEKMIAFADNKAKTFLGKAMDSKKHALTVISVLLLITVIASVAIALYSVRRLSCAHKEMKSRIHLIDQHILMANVDENGLVLDISNNLCRFLGLSKSEIIGKQSHFFIQDNSSGVQPGDILKIASTGQSWEGEIVNTNHQGESRWIYSTVHPELDDEYQVIGYSNIINDITDRKMVEKLSITDNLSQLYNRHHYDAVIDKEIKIARRLKKHLTFAIIDIDHFKNYNDNYGHPAGDATLVRVSRVLKQMLKRPNDFAFRLGGEEFGLLFSGMDPQQSQAFLNDIRRTIEALQIEHRHNSACEYVTISAGVYTVTGDETLDDNQLYIRADEALYKAKQLRNCVVVA